MSCALTVDEAFSEARGTAGVIKEDYMELSWANRLTIIRILLIIPFVSCMLKINDAALSESMRDVMRYIAILIFFTMWFSDVFDGYLARRKKQVTILGGFLDPVADKLLITSACLLLASRRGYVDGFLLPPTVVVLIIGKDLFLLIAFVIFYFVTWQFYLTTERLSKIGVGLQSSMVAGILIAPEVSAFLPGWIWFLRVLWWSAAGMAILAILDYIRKGIRYIEEYEQTNASRQVRVKPRTKF